MKKIFLVMLFLFMGFGLTYAASITNNPFPPQNNNPGPAQAGALPGAITFTQSLDTTTIASGNSVSCSAGSLHADNSYMRRFDLDGDESFNITGVAFGVELATSGTGTGQPVTVNLYTIPAGDDLEFANLTPIGQTVYTDFPDLTLEIFEAPITGTITDPQTQDLVVEIFTPDGQSAGHSFYIGSNANGQTGPSYLATADCGISEPISTGAIGFPDMHILMIVHGDDAASIPTLSEWGVILLVMLLAGTACIVIRRQQNEFQPGGMS